MKKILLFLGVNLCIGFAIAQQPSELMDNNWYIDHIVLDGISYQSPIVGLPGGVDTNIDFFADEAFAVIDPESDSFFALIEYDTNDPIFTFTEPGITLPGCQNYCEFAGLYFELLAGDFVEVVFEYQIIIIDSGDMILTITRSDGSMVSYLDYPPLGIDDLALTKVSVYPNPVSNVLFIASEITIETLTVFSISGKLVLELRNIDNSLDVSGLPQGIYFLKLTSEYGKAVQKFIKE